MKHQLQTIRSELTALHGIVGDLSEALTALSELERMAGEPVAWVHENDPQRTISAITKAGAIKDGGAIASSTKPFSLPAYAAQPAQQPQAETKKSNCTECRNSDSWGLPDQPVCKACRAGSEWAPLNRSSANPNKQPQAEAALPDPHGCNKCTHPECGRFDGPRSVECRAMAENACARKSTKQPQAEAVPTDTERAYLIGFADGKQAQQAEAVPPDLVQAVDALLSEAPCDCKPREHHLSGCHLFDLDIARNAMLAAAPKGQP